MQAPHPLGVALGKVIVHRDDVHTVSGQRIEVGRQSGDQGLAFAGAHFRDLTVMQHHAADQLNVEMTHAERPLARFTHDGEGLGQQIVERLSLGEAPPELVGLGAQRVVGERGDFAFERIDPAHDGRILLDQPVIAAAEYLFEKPGNHY